MISEIIGQLFIYSCIKAVFFNVWVIFFYNYIAKKPNVFTRIIVCFLLSYLIITLPIQGVSDYFEWKMYKFDINGDMIFSAEESTKELIYYQSVFMDDLNRPMDIIFRFLSAVLCSLFSNLFVFLVSFISKKILKNMSEERHF